MKRFAPVFLLLGIISTFATAQPLVGPFDFVMPTNDSSRSEWLPQAPREAAGIHGFLKASTDGHLEFTDGTPVRFTGVGLIYTSNFPDSLTAIATAGRLQKLGINMVRFAYMDYPFYEPYSSIATGTRSDTLSPRQMRKLDFFLYQLKQRGIYAHFMLRAYALPRSGDGVPGADSVYIYGTHLVPFSAPMQKMQRAYATALFNHVNPFTGLRYADDPEIALVTVAERTTPQYSWAVNYLTQGAKVLSYQHSRLIDTLFTEYLRRKYSSTAALRAAYFEGIHSTGPNLISNPGFEDFNTDWNLVSGEGTNANAAIVQGTDVPPGEGSNSMRVVITRTTGADAGVYLYRAGMPMHQNGIYSLSLKAKTDTAAGRPLRVIIVQGGSAALDTTVMLTKNWQSFSAIFRAPSVDSINTILYAFMGQSTGDVFLDGFSMQETGREGLGAGESLEGYNIARTTFSLSPKYPRQRVIDMGAFYDSVGHAYDQMMSAHLRSLGVRVPIAGTNLSIGAGDSRGQASYDFTSNEAFWDNAGTRNGTPYSDSTWVMNNYSVLAYRDQKIPEINRSAIAGKPFIAEAYAQLSPNAHRSEMMLYYPAYASLQDWDGAYFYIYSDGVTDSASRRSIVTSDYWSIVSDPAICALMPQVSEIIRARRIAPAERTIYIEHDRKELDELPLTFYSTHYNSYSVDLSDGSTIDNVMSMVSRVRLDSFNAARHYTGSDYYFTVPLDDNIASDTRQIVRNVTKGIMSIDAPLVQGGSGAISTAGSISTDLLRVNWIDGGKNVTYLWSSLDTTSLKKAERSLLTVTTRALNTGAVWQYGDSSLGKKWGHAPVQMESIKLGINFYTDADSLLIYPLDTTGQATGKVIAATRSANSWRATLDLATEKTPWFGVRQVFLPVGAAVEQADVAAASVGEFYPNPAGDEAAIDIALPASTQHISAEVLDLLGRRVQNVIDTEVRPGRMVIPIDTRSLPNGSYSCVITIAGRPFVRRFVVSR